MLERSAGRGSYRDPRSNSSMRMTEWIGISVRSPLNSALRLRRWVHETPRCLQRSSSTSTTIEVTLARGGHRSRRPALVGEADRKTRMGSRTGGGLAHSTPGMDYLEWRECCRRPGGGLRGPVSPTVATGPPGHPSSASPGGLTGPVSARRRRTPPRNGPGLAAIAQKTRCSSSPDPIFEDGPQVQGAALNCAWRSAVGPGPNQGCGRGLDGHRCRVQRPTDRGGLGCAGRRRRQDR
jgi:hypothetical protein